MGLLWTQTYTMSITDNKFGERLRRQREDLDLSQAAFAEMMGVHRRSQINYESGKRQPTLEYLKALQNAGIDVVRLMGTSDSGEVLRASAYFYLLSEITVLLGMRSERLSYALDQAYKITLDAMLVEDGQILLDEKKLKVEMAKLAMKLLHDEGIRDFS